MLWPSAWQLCLVCSMHHILGNTHQHPQVLVTTIKAQRVGEDHIVGGFDGGEAGQFVVDKHKIKSVSFSVFFHFLEEKPTGIGEQLKLLF